MVADSAAGAALSAASTARGCAENGGCPRRLIQILPLCFPQFGDYFQIVADSGHAYIHFNVNFEQKGGPTALWLVNGLVNQEDNFMCRFLTYPPANTQRPCSS